MKFKIPIKNKYLRFLAYAVIFLIVVRLFLSVLMFGAVGGTFGLRNQTHGCIGFTLSYETVSKYFPEGEMKIGLLGFKYFVPKKSEIQELENCPKGTWCKPPKYGLDARRFNFCLGQDVWFGE